MGRTAETAGVSDLSLALIDLLALANRCVVSGRIIDEANLSLDPALLRILGGVYRFEPVGIVELADRAGRDQTTVSRQVTKLEQFGLVERQESLADRRISEVVLSPEGRSVAMQLIAGQEKVVAELLADWSQKDRADMTRLLRRFTSDFARLKGASTAGSRAKVAAVRARVE